MTDYVVTYDLIKRKDYETLWTELRRLGGHRPLDSVWLLNVNNTSQEIHNHLKGYIDGDDRLFVCELVKNNFYSNALAGTNNWIANNPPGR